MTERVTRLLRQLTEHGVSRLEHLELLLQLSRQPGRAWSVEHAASSRSHADTDEALAHLHRHELLERVPGERPAYRLGPRADVDLLAELRGHHERDRVAVMNAFYGCTLDRLRSFASAFRGPRSS